MSRQARDRSLSVASQRGPVSTVTLYGPIRDTVGEKSVTVPGETAADILGELCDRYPSLEPQLFEDGTIRSSVQIFLEGRKIAPLDGMDTSIESDDTLQITAAMSGG